MQGDVSEIRELARDLSTVPARMIGPVYETYKQAGEAFADQWRRNARETSGEHGKWYPDSITSETRVSGDIVVDTGPQTNRRQGVMGPGFEFGSLNQDPHLDGARAMSAMEERLERMVDATIGHLLP